MFRDDLDRLNTEDIYKLVYRNPPRTQGYAYVKGSVVYWENIVAMILFTISSFVLSRPVISMKTFLVLTEIFEWFPLMIGGREQTVLFES